MADEAELDYALLDGAGAAGSIFFPRPDPGPPPTGASDHLIEVEPGVSVAARFYVLGPSHPTVLFFHGNGEVVGDHDNFAPLYHEAGLNLFVAEFRGYGKSGGRPSVAAPGRRRPPGRGALPCAARRAGLLRAALRHGPQPRHPARARGRGPRWRPLPWRDHRERRRQRPADAGSPWAGRQRGWRGDWRRLTRRRSVPFACRR